MTMDKKVTLLQSMLEDDSEQTAVLEAYLEVAGQKILNRMYQFATPEQYDSLTVPDKYALTQVRIAQFLLNKRGAEFEVQHIENGIHRNFGATDIPDEILKDVTPFCQVIG